MLLIVDSPRRGSQSREEEPWLEIQKATPHFYHGTSWRLVNPLNKFDPAFTGRNLLRSYGCLWKLS